MSKKQDKKNGFKLGFFTQIIVAVLLFAILSGAYALLAGGPKINQVDLSHIATLVNGGNLKSVVVDGNTIDVTTTDGTISESQKEPESSFSDTLKNYGVTADTLSKTPITIKTNSGIGYWLITLLPIILPILFMVFFIWFLFGQMRNAGGGGMKAFSFGQSKARVTDPNDKKKQVTFADVAGNTEAKQELLDVVDFLKTPKKYFDVGAKIPKGVLLTGNPGTGKTLLARAVAGEAGVPFFHLSGSEFVEMFVGVGASRVRDLFDGARAVAPAIIFIDEIDAVGRSRGVGIGGGNDEREQTLNQILVEMDGFEPTEKIVVMAATNRADVLDSALLRPGRFDRRVYLSLPDRKDREAILAIHAKEKPLADGIDFKMVAARTPGFSGADLESLMNEAAIVTARENRTQVTQHDVLMSVEKVIMGPERKSNVYIQKDRNIVAYHEAGHAIVASALEYADPVHKITIIPRGNAGGYTMSLPLEERRFTSKSEYIDELAVMFGGRAAEKIIFKEITGGAESDIQTATNIARAMVTKWGMSDSLGPVAYASGRSMIHGEDTSAKEYSGDIAKKIDEEVSSLIQTALKRAEEIIIQYKDALEAVAQKLLEVETLEQAEYNAIISQFGITPKTSNA